MRWEKTHQPLAPLVAVPVYEPTRANRPPCGKCHRMDMMRVEAVVFGGMSYHNQWQWTCLRDGWDGETFTRPAAVTV